MSHHFKARYVFFDHRANEWNVGQELIMNMDHVVRFELASLGKIPKNQNLTGEVFIVNTITDDAAYPLRLTSKYLEEFFRCSE
jgi:hypothetical protein